MKCLIYFKAHYLILLPLQLSEVKQNRVHHYFKEKPPAVRDAHIINFEGEEKRKLRTISLPPSQPNDEKKWPLKTNHMSQESTVLT